MNGSHGNYSWNQNLTHLAIAIPRSISQFLGVLALMDMPLVRAASTVSIGISRAGEAPGVWEVRSQCGVNEVWEEESRWWAVLQV